MSKDDVIAANRRFYAAFRARDIAAMELIWGSADAVACIHPGAPVLPGREAVMTSWDNILSNPGTPVITPADEAVYLMGDIAFVTCLEEVGMTASALVATN